MEPLELDRELPPPLVSKMQGGETVKLKIDLTFEDDLTLARGAKGVALHPGSQAATWVVFFPKQKTRRVCPEWQLEILESAGH